MGILSFLRSGFLSLRANGGLTEGGHKINKSSALAPTNSEALSPTNPGTLESLQTGSRPTRPTYWTPEMVEAVKAVVKEKKVQVKATEQGYNLLSELDSYDTRVVKSHYKWAGKYARSETEKVGAKAGYAASLHQLRPRYAAMGATVEQSEQKANQRVSEIKKKVLETMRGGG